MKLFPALVLLAFSAVTLALPSAFAQSDSPTPPLTTAAVPAASRTWSVVGVWEAVHHAWRGMLTLQADGSLLKNDEPVGDWMLYPQQGQIMLLIRWSDWPAEVLTMIDGNRFHDKVDKGHLQLSRQGTGSATAGEADTAADANAWTPAGIWDGTHTAWSGPLTLNTDGTLTSGTDNLAGRWTLSTPQGGVSLTILWDRWAAETVPLIDANEFNGRTYSATTTLRLHRQEMAPPTPPRLKGGSGGVETRAWHQGEPPVKLIRKEEGFCALTMVTGNFEGGGEFVKVSVGDDGYWYLGGQSMQEGVAAECIVVRYGGK